MKVALCLKHCWINNPQCARQFVVERCGISLTALHNLFSCRTFARLSACISESRSFKLKGASQRTFRTMATAAASSNRRSTHFVDDNNQNEVSSPSNSDRPVLKLNKVAVVGKMTRYEFEKQRYSGLSEEEFKTMLSNRGSNYENLLTQHNKHMQTMNNLLDVLKRRGIEYRMCTRGHTEYSKDAVDWADAIITAGGDGTFLSAASKILNRNKPLIGINTDAERSEGHLCLPAKYSYSLDEALDKISESRFRWLYRQRLRVTMTGTETNFEALENGQILQHRMRERLQRTAATYFSVDDSDDDSFLIDREKQRLVQGSPSVQQKVYSKKLPVLALNEIFIGESLASVPSYYEFQVDDGPPEKQKSSGICVSTGTGSTAWSYNICRLHKESVRSVLEAASDIASNNNKVVPVDPDLVNKVTEKFARSFIFEASIPKMLYAVRDPMQNKVYSCNKPYGTGNKIQVRSRCWDAALCIDGDTSFVFNDGASINVQILPEDALRTVVLDED
ncbi:NAD kinase 2, mitochondrial isoform X1 [Ciona intestinalis]